MKQQRKVFHKKKQVQQNNNHGDAIERLRILLDRLRGVVTTTLFTSPSPPSCLTQARNVKILINLKRIGYHDCWVKHFIFICNGVKLRIISIFLLTLHY